MPIARRQDGAHVCANTEWVFFQAEDEQQRQALAPLGDMPAFRMSLIEGDGSEQIRAFLVDIGVEPLKIVRLIRWLLPKYEEGEPIAREANRRHVRFIVDALDDFSASELKDLQEIFQNIPFLWARKGQEWGVMGYAKPIQSYMPAAFTLSPDLETYLGTNPVFWLVDEFYLEQGDDTKHWLEAMKKFGVADLPRRVPNTRDPLSDEYKKLLRAKIRYTKDYATQDWLLEGLGSALTRIKERQADAHATSVALWRLLARLLPPEESKRKAFFKGTYCWMYRTRYEETFDATFYKQLKQYAWLPDEEGGYHKPQDPDLFAPGSQTRSILGSRVQYLHPDLGMNEPDSASRTLANVLGIKLTANIDAVLNLLEGMSGQPADVADVTRMYQFLNRVISSKDLRFAEKALIYTPLPQPRWWKSGDVFWADERPVFGDDRGYLESYYPTLKAFFGLVDVSPNAAFPDYVRALQDLAAEATITPDVCRRVHALYRRIQAKMSETTDTQEQASAEAMERAVKQQAMWQQIRDTGCWLGQIKGEWAWYKRTELVLNNHNRFASLFAPHLPFWPHPDLNGLADLLNITCTSQARLSFTPTGASSEHAKWTRRVRELKAHLACFLASPILVPVTSDPAILDILDSLCVVVVAEAKVTYTLHGEAVDDPQPPSSHLEIAECKATLWITEDTLEEDYPSDIGDALEKHWNIGRLGEFVSDLLRTSSQDHVLTRWQRKGLSYERPVTIVVPDQEETPAENQPMFTDTQSAEDMELSNDDETADAIRDWPESDDEAKYDKEAASVGRVRELGNVSGGSGRQNSGHHRGGGYGGGHSGGGGEGEIHKSLKRKIRADLSLIMAGLSYVDEEYEIASGQAGSIVDLLLKDAEGRPIVVEVKPYVQPGNYTVVWQIARYKHLIAVENDLECQTVRGFLVAPKLPQDIMRKCEAMGIEYREIAL